MSARERVRRSALRWVLLLQGGALLMPFFLLAMVALGLAIPGVVPLGPPLAWQFAGLGLALPVAALTGLLLPPLRALEASAVRTLCGVPREALATGPATSWASRRRTAAWFTLHAGVGAVVSGMTLAVPPMAVVLLVYPLFPVLQEVEWSWPWDHAGAAVWTAPPAGCALLLGLAAVAHGTGALLARCAPVLLGPTPADRLAAAERRAADLAERNRLARELHDSVGHALSAVSLQAGAARHVLDTDPRFTREALAAIEETARNAVTELDSVLGILGLPGRPDGPDGPDRPGHSGRSDRSGRSGRPQEHRQQPGDGGPGRAPSLADGLEPLLARTRATGAEVRLTLDPGLGPLEELPYEVSAAAFRIVQEGLSNALRHAPGAPVRITLEAHRAPRGPELVLAAENPVPDVPVPARASGGRGLSGIAERARLLGGSARAGPEDGVWRLTARLPLRPAPATGPRTSTGTEADTATGTTTLGETNADAGADTDTETSTDTVAEAGRESSG